MKGLPGCPDCHGTGSVRVEGGAPDEQIDDICVPCEDALERIEKASHGQGSFRDRLNATADVLGEVA
ncbi:hypothetical protein DT076_16810 [Desertihabitans brevis]|uniref:Uncharacterized protein n=1 Tax=Desertihabitans brevis TaxID=2268447 RepID=A0A367YRE7_9ACTN|nr:hypothetical protein [Desertihabitans brevis]RCK68307.1 hypothetical protein DT076_16810 [Desertihabitans brevis]